MNNKLQTTFFVPRSALEHERSILMFATPLEAVDSVRISAEAR
jgi:hypothetical protein